MKRNIILWLIAILALVSTISCNQRFIPSITDPLIITTIYINQPEIRFSRFGPNDTLQPNTIYRLIINDKIYLNTNKLYQIGDTIK